MRTNATALRLVEPETDPWIGRLLDGRYRLEAALGKGGMGMVYRARHEVLGRPLAIKILSPEFSRDPDAVERFRREAQAASAVGSPHIADVSDFGALPDGSTYLAMELCDGPSLARAMQEERPFSLERTLKIARELCEALGAAHARGIVHRDLKPDNVHLVRRGEDARFVKVLDFGIAKVAGGTEKKLTQAGVIVGTPHYMSPEQCAGREVDHRTDVYALGVMLYELACGRVPFDADTLMGVLTKHVYEEPQPPHALEPAIAPGLEAVILKCLAKRPEQRYQGMAELSADLDAVARGATPVAVRDRIDRAAVTRAVVPLAPSAPVARPAVPSRPRPRRGAVAVLASLLALAAVIAFLLLPPSEPARPTPPRVERVDPVPEPDAPRTEDPPPPPLVDAVRATVELRTDPPGAEVYDASGTLLGNTPLALPRPDELARYSVRMRGHRAQSVAIGPGSGPSLTLHLARERQRPALGTTPPATEAVPPADVPVLDDGIIDPFATSPRRAR